MIAYKVVGLIDEVEKILRDEIQEVTGDINKKERLLKVRERLQEALTLLLGG